MRSVVLAGVLSLALGGGILLVANPATSRAESPATQPAAPTTQAAPINKFCPINRDTPIDPKVTYVYKGKTIGFCCPECIGDFKKDPEKYLKDLK